MSETRSKRHPKQTKASQSGRIVRKAIRIINEHGWIQGLYGSDNVGYCTVGAIHKSVPVGYRNLAAEAETQFGEWLSTHDNTIRSIIAWNDSRERTEEEVILYMSKFADEFDPQVH